MCKFQCDKASARCSKCQVGAGDLAHVWQKTVDCLAFNLPAGMGFTAGLAYGLGASASTSARLSLAAGLAPRFLASRVLLGLGATGSPAAATGLYTWWHPPAKAVWHQLAC